MPLAPQTLLMTKRASAAPFSPLSLPSLLAWFDASDTASITSSGGAVSQWNDKSGNGNHLTQATGVRQPTTGVNAVNGKNAITFANNNYMNSAISSNPLARTVFSVVKLRGALTTDAELWYPPSGGGFQLQMRGASAGSGKWAVIKSGVAVLVTSSAGDGTTNPALRVFFTKGDGSSFAHNIRLNLAADGSATSANTYSGGTAWTLGANTTTIVADVCEQIICDAITAGADLSGCESYLRTKWGTP